MYMPKCTEIRYRSYLLYEFLNSSSDNLDVTQTYRDEEHLHQLIFQSAMRFIVIDEMQIALLLLLSSRTYHGLKWN